MVLAPGLAVMTVGRQHGQWLHRFFAAAAVVPQLCRGFEAKILWAGYPSCCPTDSITAMKIGKPLI